jgi:hypothetical protein
MVMQNFDAYAGVVATRANTTITTVRMGCSVSHQYGRRRNSPAMESPGTSLGLKKCKIWPILKDNVTITVSSPLASRERRGAKVLRLNDNNPRPP